MTLQIALLASGVGTNFSAIEKSIKSGALDARICLVVSDKPEAPVLEKAREAGIPTWSQPPATFAGREDYDRAMLEAINAAGAQVVVLAGFMRILSPAFVRAFPQRIINVHPSVLPSFPGKTGAADTIAHGVRFAGATVHFVDEEVDHGPIIIQAIVPVSSNETEETLMPRIHSLEHRIYPQALQWLAEGRLDVQGRRVHLKAARIPSVKRASVNSDERNIWMISPALEDGF